MPVLSALGEAMVELRDVGPNQLGVSFAGDVFNTLAYTAKLGGSDWTTQFISAIGDDPWSEDFLGRCNELNIKPVCHRGEKQNIGLYRIHTDASGERAFSYWREHSPARSLMTSLTAQQREHVLNSDYVLISGITLAILSETQREQLHDLLSTPELSARIIFDPNYRVRLWESEARAKYWISQFYSLSDIALPGLAEETALFGLKRAEQVLNRTEFDSNHTVIVKAGEAGIFARSGEDTAHLPFKPAEIVVDTTAAGDAYTGAWLVASHRGATLLEAFEFAAGISAKVIAKAGAIVDLD